GARVADVKRKRFCNQSCAGAYNNKVRIRAKKASPAPKVPKVVPLAERTKGQLFGRGTWHLAASSIRTHARKVYYASGGARCCFVCGYDRYIEVCHIRDVSDFPDEALISEINSVNNLVGLCPNHHRELDKGFLTITAERLLDAGRVS
ncbi:MAG: HNH endonuclease, partial [Nitrososphaera sp.]|nr:HNH endonuclease [Nitrososphaera sp.]